MFKSLTTQSDILSLDQARHCAKLISDYYKDHTRIDEYMRKEKIASMKTTPSSLIGCEREDDLFDDFTMSPEGMDFEIVFNMNPKLWTIHLNTISSFVNHMNPGRNIPIAIREIHTGKYVGFIRLGSPVVMMSPRNQVLNSVVTNLKSFNQTTMMGFVIVPCQPFGFNYLGGKLLAGICCSHEIREHINQRFNMNLCLFETTSLYGKTKTMSQYDGMEPYLRYGGKTLSLFPPQIHDSVFNTLVLYVENVCGLGELVPRIASSRKWKIHQRIFALVTKSLRVVPIEQREFKQVLDQSMDMQEQKRYYYCHYGVKNFRDVVTGKTDQLEFDSQQKDKYNLKTIIQWWKQKATKRYETLQKENRLRTSLELWHKNQDIDIIR